MSSTRRRYGRRSFLAGGASMAASLSMLALVGCSSDDGSEGDSGGGGGSSSTPAGTPTQSTPIPDAGTPVPGGMIRTEWIGTTSLWDPYRASTGFIHHYSAITERMIDLDPNTLDLKGALIESWEEIEPGMEWVLHVQPDVIYEDKAPVNGRQFDAEDVVYNIRYGSGLLDPESANQIARSSWYGNISSVEVVDDLTVSLKMAEPNGAILGAIADMRQMALPREIPEQMPFTDFDKFPSIGPFTIRDFRDGESAHYDRNPNYWREGKPYVDSAEIRWFGDSSSAVAALLSGDVDTCRVSGPQVAQVQGASGNVELAQAPFRAHDVYFINADRFPDERVWKAMHNLFDYQGTMDAVRGVGSWDYSGPLDRALQGTYKPEEIRQMPGYNPDTRDADVAEGLKLLEAAGYPRGAGLSFNVLGSATGSGVMWDATIRFQATLQELAPDMKFELIAAPDTSGFQRALADRDYDIVAYTIYEGPDTRLAALNYTTGTSRNYANYSNTAVDDLVVASWSQTGDELLATIRAIEDELIGKSNPVLVLAGVYDQIGRAANLRGLEEQMGYGSDGAYNIPSTSRKHVWFAS